MNLVEFLKCTDANIAEMSKETLGAFVHELARKYPSKDRNAFLRLMNEAKRTDNADVPSAVGVSKALSEKVSKAVALLKEISEKKDRRLQIAYNDEYDERRWDDPDDDWYDPDDKYTCDDPGEILPDVEECIDLMHRCLEEKAYNLGFEIAVQLSELGIPEE